MNLPQTDFPMRANLAKNEPKRLEKWNEQDIYFKVLEKNKDGEPFILHDGPPYANGPIHIGHAFNKILKDFVNKSHAQRGFFTPYVPGWDCHGQPIENMVEKTMGTEKFKETPQPEVRKACRAWAEKYIDIQRDGFKRLGVNADWDHPYLTFIPNFEAGNVEIFKKLYLEGNIYRGRKPIHWCKRCHTALAEAEIEYGDEMSPSIFVNFKLHSIPEAFAQAGVTEAYVLIWTTTPWTLPANTAVTLAPEADYCMVVANGKTMLFAHELVETVAELAQWEAYEVVADAAGNPVVMKGKDLLGVEYTCPIRQDLTGKIIYGDHVTMDSGTGAVHTAPGHGQEDYMVALEFDVPILMPVDDNGRLTSEAGKFEGLDTDEANPEIIAWLEEQGTLVAKRDISHSYPHCWRCHQPVIFRATDQWFVSMDKNNLRERSLEVIRNNVNWVPEWAVNRIGAMVEDRPDWCISRQRSWGVPVPVFKCAQCDHTVANEETFDAVIDLFYEKGADAWFTTKPSEYLPAGTKCEHCGCEELIPETDILDVWWESGVTHQSVLRHRASEGLRFPADLYLEGSDQHRGWFQSSLITSVGANDCAPYKNVMHCGFIVDANGRKMSKSLGNGVDPADVIAQRGADVLRLWVASVDYSQDVSISDEILQRTSDAYRRIRNTFRFLLGSLSDFDVEKDAITNWNDLTALDQWALVRLQNLLFAVEANYETYRFHGVYRDIYDYIVGDLSAVYLDACKDRLYSDGENSRSRRACQTVLMNILDVLVRVLSPILSFTTDEVWEHYPEAMRNVEGRVENVQLAGWPTAETFVPAVPAEKAEGLTNQFAAILEVREAVMKALEAARSEKRVNKSQEAAVVITAPAEMLELLNLLDEQAYENLFIVSGVSFVAGEELAVEVKPAEGEKCPRCWNYRTLGENANHPEVCARCAAVLDEQGFVEAE